MDIQLPQIFYVNGKFLVFDKNHAIALRSRRIVGRLIGCPSGLSQQIVISSLPCYISPSAASLAHERRLATFMKLVKLDDTSVVRNVANFEAILSAIRDEAKRNHLERRQEELRRRNIQTNEDRFGTFDENKVRLTVDASPVLSRSHYSTETIDDDEIKSILDRQVNVKKKIVYRDLYQKGFYVTSGTKFGCEFLAYPGDPVLYHAKFALRIVPDLDGHIDFSKIDINEMNALNRLCHTANKIALFVVVSQDDSNNSVEYWTTKSKEYLTTESRSALFKCPILRFDSHDGISPYHDHSEFGARR